MTMPQYHDFSGFAINLYVLGMVTVDCKMPAILAIFILSVFL